MKADKKWVVLKKSTKQMVIFFASKVAMKYNMELSHCLQKAEDIQWDCYQCFDESKNTKFSTYLYQSLKTMYSWAWREKRLIAEIPDEIYNQILVPEERTELNVPEHLENLSNAIIMGYGIYFANDRLSETKESLKELAEQTGMNINQVYLQLNELRHYLMQTNRRLCP